MALDGRKIGIANAKAVIWRLLRGQELSYEELLVAFRDEATNLEHRFDAAFAALNADGAVVSSEFVYGAQVRKVYKRNPSDAIRRWTCPECRKQFSLAIGRLGACEDCEVKEQGEEV
jgi:hypothetical protein